MKCLSIKDKHIQLAQKFVYQSKTLNMPLSSIDNNIRNARKMWLGQVSGNYSRNLLSIETFSTESTKITVDPIPTVCPVVIVVVRKSIF